MSDLTQQIPELGGGGFNGFGRGVVRLTMANNSTPLKAPFPAFGGKSKVAELVWSRLGDVDNYIEPFCNSAAVLLRRPHAPRIETINDIRWERTTHEICVGGIRYSTKPDEFGIPELHAAIRTAIINARGSRT